MMEPQKPRPFGLRTIMELFDVGPGVAFTALALCLGVIVLAVGYFIHSAPPSEITISTGPEGSSSDKRAQAYAKILARNGVKLKILRSNGSSENLERLQRKRSHVDIGFVQAGIAQGENENLVSLGSIAYQPLMVFYRGKTIERLSGLAGKKIAIGAKGSGVRVVALALLAQNEIKEGAGATLLDLEAEDAARALLDRKIDAAFVMGESTPMPVLRSLLRSNEVQLFSFKQASAYARRIDYLNVLDLPEGAIDLGLDIPSHDVTLVGPMVELIATKKLHPAVSDLMLEAMVETHSRPGIFQKRGEFPNPQEHSIKISEDAARFYKSGKGLLYRFLPFWLASLISRLIFAFLPTLVVLVPIMRSVPALFRWRVNIKIRRHYRELIDLEKRLAEETDPAKQAELRREFDRIEQKVHQASIQPAFAEQFYGLRGHINYVRDWVGKNT